jgi:hypothetical protein
MASAAQRGQRCGDGGDDERGSDQAERDADAAVGVHADEQHGQAGR